VTVKKHATTYIISYSTKTLLVPPLEAVPTVNAQKYSGMYVMKHTVKCRGIRFGLTWTLEVDV
jgi:hypothetical protein